MTRVTASTRPPGLLPAAVLVALEGIAALAYGVFEVFQIRPERLVVGLGAGILLVGYGVALLALARGLLRVRRWTRAPVVATQLIHLPLAWNFREGGTAWFAVLLGLASVVVLVCMFLPSSTAALAREVSGPDDAPDPPRAPDRKPPAGR